MRMRPLRPTLSLSMAMLFAINLPGLVAAQMSSPELVGVGGRVEVAEAGYALTLPDD